MALEHAGKSIIQMLWEQMDIKYAKLFEMEEPDIETDADEVITEYYELKGQCTGLAYALSKMTNPYMSVKQGMDAIRAEAAERYDAEYGEDED